MSETPLSQAMLWAAARAAHESELALLRTKLEAYDHLLACKRGWLWDLQRRGMSVPEAGVHMILCNREANLEPIKEQEV